MDVKEAGLAPLDALSELAESIVLQPNTFKPCCGAWVYDGLVRVPKTSLNAASEFIDNYHGDAVVGLNGIDQWSMFEKLAKKNQNGWHLRLGTPKENIATAFSEDCRSYARGVVRIGNYDRSVSYFVLTNMLARIRWIPSLPKEKESGILQMDVARVKGIKHKRNPVAVNYGKYNVSDILQQGVVTKYGYFLNDFGSSIPTNGDILNHGKCYWQFHNGTPGYYLIVCRYNPLTNIVYFEGKPISPPKVLSKTPFASYDVVTLSYWIDENPRK